MDFSAHIKIEDFEISHATGGLLVIKYDKEGNKIWHQFTSSYNTGPFGYLQPVSMFVANDNEIYLSGMIKGQLLFGNTFVKTHSNDYSELFVGKISQKNMVSLRESSVNESLWQVYPNPSGDIFYLNSLNADEMLITVTDVRGQLVKTIIDKNQRKVDLTGLANGMYLLKIQCGNRSETKKIVKN